MENSSREPETSSKNARFFFLKRTDASANEKSFSTTSPFLVQKILQSTVGDVPSIKKLPSGDLLVQVSSPNQADSLLKLTTFGSYTFAVSPHGSLNRSRGVISESDLLYTSDEEILENLRDQDVCGVRRIMFRRDGKLLPTKHLVLTFDTPTLPTQLKAGYLSCRVRPYIPNPLRCFKCQRYGHSKASCRGSTTCARCANVGHESENCTASPRCVNCDGDHPAYSRSCRKWDLEKEVQSVKTKQNLSYPEARKIVESRTPKVGVTYAAAATKSMSSTATQTDAKFGFSFAFPSASSSASTSTLFGQHNSTPKTTLQSPPVVNSSVNQRPFSQSTQKVTPQQATSSIESAKSALSTFKFSSCHLNSNTSTKPGSGEKTSVSNSKSAVQSKSSSKQSSLLQPPSSAFRTTKTQMKNIPTKPASPKSRRKSSYGHSKKTDSLKFQIKNPNHLRLPADDVLYLNPSDNSDPEMESIETPS